MYKVLLIGFMSLAISMAGAQTSKLEKVEAEADTLMDHEDYAGAIKLYSKHIKSTKLKQREDYGVVYKRALAYYSIGDFQHSLEDLNQFITQFPQVPQSLMLRGMIHKELGDKEKQLKDLASALMADPANPNLLKWRASIYVESDEYELAKKDAKIASLFQDDPQNEIYLGLSYYNLGDVDSAMMSINKSISLDATYLPAYLYGGSFSLEQENFEQALKYLDLAQRLDPGNTTVHFYRGIAMVEMEKVDEGCRLLRKAFYGGMDDAADYLKEYCFGVEN